MGKYMSWVTSWLWVLIPMLCGALVSASLHRFTPATTIYHYEQPVEITGGFYKGRGGIVRGCYSSLAGYRTYTVRLKSGELVFEIDEANLKAAAADASYEGAGHGTGY